MSELKELMKKIDMHSAFEEENIDEKIYMSKVDELADKAFEDQCTPANPRLPLVTELKELLLEAYYGELEEKNN